MSQGAEPDFFLVDGETFNALRRVVRRLHADDPLVGEDRRSLAIRMNALLQRAQPDGCGAERRTPLEGAQPERRGTDRLATSSEFGAPSGLLKEGFWKLSAHA